MKLLFDQNLSFKLCDRLADLFPASSQLRLLGLDRTDDLDVFRFARDVGFVIVTQDGDFADLSALYGAPPKILWLRGGNQPTAMVERVLRDHFGVLAEFIDDPELSCLELY